jgi:hypothetical protein
MTLALRDSVPEQSVPDDGVTDTCEVHASWPRNAGLAAPEYS